MPSAELRAEIERIVQDIYGFPSYKETELVDRICKAIDFDALRKLGKNLRDIAN